MNREQSTWVTILLFGLSMEIAFVAGQDVVKSGVFRFDGECRWSKPCDKCFPSVENGHIEIAKNNSATVSCDPGFEHHTRFIEKASCAADSTKPSRVVKPTCEECEQIENGIITFHANGTAAVNCNPGSALIDVIPDATCVNGNESQKVHATPSCSKCEMELNGEVEYRANFTAVVNCSPGFTLVEDIAYDDDYQITAHITPTCEPDVPEPEPEPEPELE